MGRSIVVRATRDDEASVWIAASNDVPGLATEAETLEALQNKLQVMIPELLEENAVDLDDDLMEHTHPGNIE